MFGDKILLGQSDIVIDDKSRMFLPARTNREKGDILVLLSYSNTRKGWHSSITIW